jgi:hypothetical protein
LCGQNGISAKRKFIASGTREIDSDTWIAHESPTFTACLRRATPTRGLFLRGEGTESDAPTVRAIFFRHSFNPQTLRL